MSSTDHTKRFRWLPRFGLRTLLIVMCVLGAALGLGGSFRQRLLAHRSAIAKIEGAGGNIVFAHEFGHYVEDFSGPREYESSGIRTLPSGVRERKRVTTSKAAVDYESPPGPAVLRALLGDNAFASVDRVIFSWQSNTDELEPSLLEQFPHLRDLWLAEAQVSNEWLDQCVHMAQLRMLRLASDSAVTETLSLDLLGKLTQLSALSLSGSRVGSQWGGDAMCTEVGKLRQLKSLSIYRPLPMTSQVFRDLRELKNLESLTIRRAPLLVDQGSENLAALQSLKALGLPETSLGDKSLATIAKLKQLESLDLSNTHVTDAGLKQLPSLRSLRHLDLSGTQVGDEGVQSLANLQELRILSLNYTQITTAAIPTIVGLRNLEVLDLKSTPIDFTDEQLKHLHSLKKLRRIVLGPRFSTSGVDALSKALPECGIFAWDANRKLYGTK